MTKLCDTRAGVLVGVWPMSIHERVLRSSSATVQFTDVRRCSPSVHLDLRLRRRMLYGRALERQGFLNRRGAHLPPSIAALRPAHLSVHDFHGRNGVHGSESRYCRVVAGPPLSDSLPLPTNLAWPGRLGSVLTEGFHLRATRLSTAPSHAGRQSRY